MNRKLTYLKNPIPHISAIIPLSQPTLESTNRATLDILTETQRLVTESIESNVHLSDIAATEHDLLDESIKTSEVVLRIDSKQSEISSDLVGCASSLRTNVESTSAIAGDTRNLSGTVRHDFGAYPQLAIGNTVGTPIFTAPVG